MTRFNGVAILAVLLFCIICCEAERMTPDQCAAQAARTSLACDQQNTQQTFEELHRCQQDTKCIRQCRWDSKQRTARCRNQLIDLRAECNRRFMRGTF